MGASDGNERDGDKQIKYKDVKLNWRGKKIKLLLKAFRSALIESFYKEILCEIQIKKKNIRHKCSQLQTN